MRTKIFARGFVRKELEGDMRGHARHMLGRLRHHVALAELSLRKENEEADEGVYTCNLRLRLREAADVVVLTRGSGVGSALAGAFRRARHELLRRRRRAASVPAWLGKPRTVPG